MGLCVLCEDQTKKSSRGKPHERLEKIDKPRVFKGQGPRGFEEQDYQCLDCQARFTQSTNRYDRPWTLWQG